ncbi:hypothetical protein BX600DRAFT_32297 [Xylariales sp. PMI_506]|nr:hypothetical protein BX600DRAFT_32297 [Xylariales sp. PMI_506]
MQFSSCCRDGTMTTLIFPTPTCNLNSVSPIFAGAKPVSCMYKVHGLITYIPPPTAVLTPSRHSWVIPLWLTCLPGATRSSAEVGGERGGGGSKRPLGYRASQGREKRLLVSWWPANRSMAWMRLTCCTAVHGWVCNAVHPIPKQSSVTCLDSRNWKNECTMFVSEAAGNFFLTLPDRWVWV